MSRNQLCSEPAIQFNRCFTIDHDDEMVHRLPRSAKTSPSAAFVVAPYRLTRSMADESKSGKACLFLGSSIFHHGTPPQFLP
jgi:hypothetical protein